MGLGGSVLGAAAGVAMPAALFERIKDDDSLIAGDLASAAWRTLSVNFAPSVRAYAALSDRGIKELVAVNDGLCPYAGALERYVTIPDGISTVRFVLPEVALQSGLSETEPFTLELRDSSGSTVVGSVTYEPTATSTEVTSAAFAVTSGTEYMVRVCCNETGQSQFVCGKLRLEPVTVTDSFWSSFTRIDVNDTTILDSVESGYYPTGRYPKASQFAHVDVLTDAKRVVVSWYDNVNDFLGNRGYPGVFVDGYPMPVLTTSFGRINHESITIPSGGRRIKCLSVWAGPQAVKLLPSPVEATENIGTFPTAIYVPQSAYLDVVQEGGQSARRHIAMLVDSKGSGYYSSNPAIEGIVPTLRRAGIRVTSVGCGGDSIYRYTGATLTADACLPLAKKLLKRRPDEVVIQIGRNDFVANTFTPADLITQMGNLADAIHSLDGRVLVTFMTWTREVTEADELGVSWNDERDEILALDAGREGWCRVLDSAEDWTSTDVATYAAFDTVHLSDKGQRKFADHIITGSHQFSIHQLSSLFSWHEFDGRMVGGNPGSVTATGGSAPTVTLGGTSTVSGKLIIEIKLGGNRGAARFRWGLDGYGWIEHDVQTLASVALPIGISINFDTGSYSNLLRYTAPIEIGTVYDRSSTGGHHAVALSTQRASFDITGMAGKPAALFAITAPGDAYKVTGINVPHPFTVIAVAQMTAAAATRAIIGRTATGTGLLMHSDAGGTNISVNDGTVTRNTAATMSNVNLFILRANTGSSSMRVNGAQTNFALTGTALTGYQIGCDGVSSAFNFGGYIRRIIVCSAAISDGECRAVESLCRAEGYIT